jgi:hypothetical protein
MSTWDEDDAVLARAAELIEWADRHGAAALVSYTPTQAEYLEMARVLRDLSRIALELRDLL